MKPYRRNGKKNFSQSEENQNDKRCLIPKTYDLLHLYIIFFFIKVDFEYHGTPQVLSKNGGSSKKGFVFAR